MPRTSPHVYVDIHGRPLNLEGLAQRAQRTAEAATAPAPPQVELKAPDIEAVFDAMCLAGTAKGKTWLTEFLRHLGQRHSTGHAFTVREVGEAARQLVGQGRAVSPHGEGFDVPEATRAAWFVKHLEPALAARAWPAWARASATYGGRGTEVPTPALKDTADTVAFARLLLHAGLDATDFAVQRQRMFSSWNDGPSIAQAALGPFMPERFESLDPGLRAGLLQEWLNRFILEVPLWSPLLAWLDARAVENPAGLSETQRLALAGWRTDRADAAGALQLLQPVQSSRADACRAAVLAMQGQWVQAATAFAAANKVLCAEANARRGLLGSQHLRWYLLSLLAQPAPQAWAAARKLAMAESGSRKPDPIGWGLWAHAAAARVGDEPADASAFAHHRGWGGEAPHRENADRLLLAAWVGHEPARWGDAEVQAVVQHFEAMGRWVWADLMRQAAARFGWTVPPHTRPDAPWPVAVFGGPREAWRDALAAISALGEQKGSSGAEHSVDPTLLWQMKLDDVGRVIDIVPFERPTSSRSRALPKPVPLSRIKKSVRLDPRDAAVARCIDKSGWYGGGLGLDVPGAAMALIHHPGVTLDDQPGQPVELRETLPELEVRRARQGDGTEAFEFHLLDPIFTEQRADLGNAWVGGNRAEETDRRNSLRVLRDGDDRARLIRITPAQRRVAELVRQRWAVPVDAKAELEAALRVLAGHFQLHSDAAAGQGVASQARLTAQLVPRGDALQLRLVARPFGSFGPVVPPGQGRARLLTVHEGLQLSTDRQLEAERAHLEQVLEALPFLSDADEGDATWLLDDPEQALHVLEVLPQLPGVAELEWPRGKPVRVTSITSQGVKVALSSGREWFSVDGEVQVDDTRVLSLQRLLQLMQESRQGRFVALGEGEYLALTERLRTQLADLQAMSEPTKDGLRLPAASAAFVAQALEGTQIEADKPWAKRLARLEQAAALQPVPPAGLMAELRSYQAEGFAWMARLAHAGLGAILADDMGLGKTVQTLALLLHRAALGPALVIAPTSVCGNWVAEAGRFAPSLRVLSFGEGDRAEMLQTCGPGDVVVASYGLTQIEGQTFATREWATLVLDEAQALKNAATKRAKAIVQLKADFRLALSGTPVENRLNDLWSLMNLLNPGLLGSSGQFTERFAGPIERQRDEAVRSRLRRLVSPFLLRRTKAQVLADLPPRTEIVHRVEPGPEERAFLEATRRSAIERVEHIEETDAQASFHVLAELTRLRRAACDPRLAAPELGLIGAKVQEFERLATELVAGRHKALVFSQFTDFLDLLAQRLQAAGLSYQMLTGSTPAAERTRRVAAFQAGEGDLFLISLKAGGFGLNLTAADYVIIVDPWWNPAAEDQASGRAHRIGQQRPVTVYRLVTAGSIEERIIELHRHKRDLADGILEGQDQGKPLGAAEWRELLEP
ncbi:MAG: DEAD/DEAH box helicase [Rubrivivax sp.]